ncbi:MAG: hypothetical protein KME16_14290 [Scytolyngbya sp. HA4215-MV1]|nr:hypothetical protein [Scytolyngbya sp. HA4215-MV1]
MSTQDQARALMVRHHQLIKNRQQSMLTRSAAEVGMPSESTHFWNHIQGKPLSASTSSYDRSHASFS